VGTAGPVVGQEESVEISVPVDVGVVPGGVVVYQTYTVEQAKLGRPRNPDYLLRQGELRGFFAGWDVLTYRELVGPTRRGGPKRAVAGIVARKPD